MARAPTKASKAPNATRLSRTSLHEAVIDANTKEVARLLAAGSNVNCQDDQGWTPLHFAAQSQSSQIVKQLLVGGASVDLADGHGNTPLFRAVFSYEGDGATINMLRDSGANPNTKNNHGVSPVELARNIANYDVSKYFSDVEDAE